MPDNVVADMKANFTLPFVGPHTNVDSILWIGLPREQAQAIVARSDNYMQSHLESIVLFHTICPIVTIYRYNIEGKEFALNYVPEPKKKKKKKKNSAAAVVSICSTTSG